eukprot:TRINITY_DN18_c0_g1_i14.p1 TRINITY_DN18_c0_g1~~TRINITY_DN18_c0_g1_i14.p1  ORF type:complete len:300 (+),score=-70.18 TRINITY_DN18_c0_g1_i14:860-1759(+)
MYRQQRVIIVYGVDYQGIQSCSLPTLSCISVNYSLVSCLRNRCSVLYLCISPLHNTFRLPQLNSRLSVSMAVLQLSCKISPLTQQSAYAPFKPNKSGQRSHPPYYRGCWHGVSRCLFMVYLQITTRSYIYSTTKEVYNSQNSLPSRGLAGSELPPLTNIPHCCLPQESGPCLSTSVGDHPLRTPRHRSLGEPLPHQLTNVTHAHLQPPELQMKNDAESHFYGVLIPISRGYPPVKGRLHTRYAPVRRSSAEASFPVTPRLACVRPVASVHPEPGSNSSLYKSFQIILLVGCIKVFVNSN